MALDGGIAGKDTLSFGIFLSRLTHSKLTGIFFENQPEDQRPVLKKMYDGTYLEWEVDENSTAWQKKMQSIGQSIEQFKAFYANHDIDICVHRDKGVPVKELIAETRYADLLVVDAETSFRKELEKLPTAFVEEMLAKAECPVVIAPGSFDGVDEIVFAWDGSQSATFAIKLFTYLFPQLSDKKIIIVHAKETGAADASGKSKMKEWLEHHYNAIQWEELTGEADAALFGFLLTKKKVFIVFGAYGRSVISRFFQHSHAEKVIKTIAQPMFIAHC